MEGRALRILLGLLALTILLLWAVRPKRPKVAEVELALLSPGVDARVDGVTLFQSSPQGDLTLRAREADWTRAQETFRLIDVDLRFLSSGTSGAAAPFGGRIVGERGSVRTPKAGAGPSAPGVDGREFELAGRVVAETFDGYRLETSDVRYRHDTRQAETEAAVVLDGPGLHVTGKGARLDYGTQAVEVGGRVEARLVPAILEQAESPPGEPIPGTKPEELRPIDVDADQFELSGRDTRGVFRGNVVARQGDVTIRATAVDATYSQKANAIVQAVATGEVTVTSGAKVGKSERAEFDNGRRTVVLSGEPRLWEEGTVLEGREIVFHVDDGRVECFDCSIDVDPERIQEMQTNGTATPPPSR